MSAIDRTVRRALDLHGVSRRQFLQLCTSVASVLALPPGAAQQIAQTLPAAERLPVVWLHGQECTGDDESVLRAANPSAEDVLFDLISLEYFATMMADSGAQAEAQLAAAMERYSGRYIVIQEGSIPTGDNAYYCTVGGRTSEDILRRAAANAAAVICTGACAAWGGWPASRPNPTGASGVSKIVTNKPVVNLTGCPHNGFNLVATIVHFLTYNRLPELDSVGRPLFAHGIRIHDNCERRAHFDAGQFVEQWGDVGHRQGWCLYRMGCKGPEAYFNCPTLRWNSHTSWPVMAGHGCIACGSFYFWDQMTPFYGRLPGVPGVPVETSIDRAGAILMGLTLAGIAAHAAATIVWDRPRRQAAEPPPIAIGGTTMEVAPPASEQVILSELVAPPSTPDTTAEAAPPPSQDSQPAGPDTPPSAPDSTREG